MTIGGLQKLSLQDYPDHVAAIIFTSGCNFRCHFCHNPQLVVPDCDGAVNLKGHSSISEDGLFGFLRAHAGKLEAAVITGGEPTIHSDLPEFIKKIKNLGYLVKLDTNGTNPNMLEFLFKNKLLDYTAMDIKASLPKYKQVVGTAVSLSNLKKSIKMIMKSNIPYEFRTTVVPEFHQAEDISKMGEQIQGADKWYLQKFRPNVDLVDPKFKSKKSYMGKEMIELKKIALKFVKYCEIR